MSADYSRIHRLLHIITLIQGSDGWTAERLAGEFEVAERTIFRDLKALEGAGVPYYFDEERRCYRINQSFFMPPVELTFEEALAVIALGEHIARQEQIPLMRPAARAIAKIRSHLPPTLRRDIEALDEHFAIQLAPGGPYEGYADVYDRVRQAIARGKALQCTYEAADRSGSTDTATDEPPFRFEPYVLFFNQRAWYTIGHHGGRGELRCLKLNRFTAVKVTDENYHIPGDFSLSGYLGNAWRMIRGEPTYDVELHFDAAFAETIADTQWHPTQEVEHLDDGSLILRCRVDGLDEILWWVLSMGPHCVVKKPAELADRVRRAVRQMLERYEAQADAAE